jgi:hypothetical protein
LVAVTVFVTVFELALAGAASTNASSAMRKTSAVEGRSFGSRRATP